MKKMTILRTAIGGILMLSLCNSCGHHSGESHSHDETVHEEEGHGHEEIVFEAEKAAAAGVKADTVHAGPFRSVIRTSGKISPAVGNEISVVANMTGIISFLSPIAEGSEINGGSVIFSISSNNMQDGDPVKKAFIAYETARKEYERAAILVKDRIVSQQEYENIKSNYETARIAYEALGGSEDGGAAVKAPASGHASGITVTDGEYVTAGQQLMKIITHDRMYLRADLSGKYAGQLGSITSANFSLPFSDRIYELSEMGGKIIARGQSIDENSAYLPVTFEFRGGEGIISGSFAEVWLLADEREGIIAVPAGALIEEQGEHYVYRRLDADCYEKVHVTTGASDGKMVEILSGVHDGDIIVTEGAMRIKLASASNSIPGHTHNH